MHVLLVSSAFSCRFTAASAHGCSGIGHMEWKELNLSGCQTPISRKNESSHVPFLGLRKAGAT